MNKNIAQIITINIGLDDRFALNLAGEVRSGADHAIIVLLRFIVV